MNTHKLKFHYDKRGFGNLILLSDEDDLMVIPSRTGNIGSDGVLKNALPPQTYYIRNPHEEPVATERDVMELGEIAWKIRLWKNVDGVWEFTHLLIHPDGSVKHKKDGNGTGGCIGTQEPAWGLCVMIDKILIVQEVISVDVLMSNSK